MSGDGPDPECEALPDGQTGLAYSRGKQSFCSVGSSLGPGRMMALHFGPMKSSSECVCVCARTCTNQIQAHRQGKQSTFSALSQPQGPFLLH